MKPEHRIADVLRLVGLRLENAIDEGRRSTRIDANDLLETLYAVADELDPQTPVGATAPTTAALGADCDKYD